MSYNFRKALAVKASPNLYPLPSFKVKHGGLTIPLMVRIEAVPSSPETNVVVNVGNAISQSYVLTNGKCYTMYVFDLADIHVINTSPDIALLNIHIFTDDKFSKDLQNSDNRLWMMYYSEIPSPALADTNYICFYNHTLSDNPPETGWITTGRMDWGQEGVVPPILTYTSADVLTAQSDQIYGQGEYYRAGTAGIDAYKSDGVDLWGTYDYWKLARVALGAEQEVGLPDCALPWVNDGTNYEIFGE